MEISPGPFNAAVCGHWAYNLASAVLWGGCVLAMGRIDAFWIVAGGFQAFRRDEAWVYELPDLPNDGF